MIPDLGQLLGVHHLWLMHNGPMNLVPVGESGRRPDGCDGIRRRRRRRRPRLGSVEHFNAERKHKYILTKSGLFRYCYTIKNAGRFESYSLLLQLITICLCYLFSRETKGSLQKK